MRNPNHLRNLGAFDRSSSSSAMASANALHAKQFRLAPVKAKDEVKGPDHPIRDSGNTEVTQTNSKTVIEGYLLQDPVNKDGLLKSFVAPPMLSFILAVKKAEKLKIGPALICDVLPILHHAIKDKDSEELNELSKESMPAGAETYMTEAQKSVFLASILGTWTMTYIPMLTLSSKDTEKRYDEIYTTFSTEYKFHVPDEYKHSLD